MTETKGLKKRILAAICVLAMACMQAYVLVPAITHGATAGDVLSVRVQYFGDRGDKLREKASFTRSQLESMGASTYCYSNLTNVATVMVMKARGPKVTTIIAKSGIDLASIQNITFRTTDGYTRNFNGGQISGTAYYYPKLNMYSDDEPETTEKTEKTEETTEKASSTESTTTKQTEPATTTTTKHEEATEPAEAKVNKYDPKEPLHEQSMSVNSLSVKAENKSMLNYERADDGQTIIPRKGSLKGTTTVPAILALEFGATKKPGISAESLSMGRSQTYRFCLGQSKLTEGKRTKAGYGGGDVSSADSCHSIYGIDVTLKGSPVTGIGLSIANKNMKVGSTGKIKAAIKGDELFSEYLNTKTLKWKSSDTSIATVDKNGVVTIKKNKAVTITATALDGTKASITINGKSGGSSSSASSSANIKSDTVKSKSQTKNAIAQPLVVREISLGEKISPEDVKKASANMQSTEDVQKLEATEEYDIGVAAGSAIAAALACGGGALFRIRRFHINR